MVSVTRLVPGGATAPNDVPPEIFSAALSTFLSGRRLDMRALAGSLGIGRATLYRRAGSRDRLLGEVLCYLARRALVRALEEAGDARGRDRVLVVMGRFMRSVHDQPPFRRLLAEEPEAALRVLTSKRGEVQGCLTESVERILAEEQARGDLDLTIDARTLAYVIVRIGESFLYADVIADNEPDLAQALEVIGRLVPAPHGESLAA